MKDRDNTSAYLDLMKRALSNYLYVGGGKSFARFTIRDSYKHFTWRIPEIARPHTLMNKGKLDVLEHALRDVHAKHVPGDFIEAGVWNGGATIFMRAFLKAHGITDRVVWVADSFAGIPKSRSVKNDPVDRWKDRWVSPVSRVKANFSRYDLLDDQVKFICGQFHDTLPSAAIERIAVLRLDCDSYQSYRDVLSALYDKVSPGGHIIVDDWHLPSCRAAVLDFRMERQIKSPLIRKARHASWRVGRRSVLR